MADAGSRSQRKRKCCVWAKRAGETRKRRYGLVQGRLARDGENGAAPRSLGGRGRTGRSGEDAWVPRDGSSAMEVALRAHQRLLLLCSSTACTCRARESTRVVCVPAATMVTCVRSRDKNEAIVPSRAAPRCSLFLLLFPSRDLGYTREAARRCVESGRGCCRTCARVA